VPWWELAVNDYDIAGSSGDQRAFWQVLAQFDGPAILRRARIVEEAWQMVLRQCQEKRANWLEFPRLRLATLMCLAGDPTILAQVVGDGRDADRLLELNDEWAPRLRCPVATTRSPRRLRRAFIDLVDSFQRFNERWGRFLEKLELTGVNRLREGYNRHYLVEKECAVGSPVIARMGFQPLPLVTSRDVLAELPFLPLFQSLDVDTSRRTDGDVELDETTSS
jgi:hypothetical protein